MPGVADHAVYPSEADATHIGGKLTVTEGTAVQDHIKLLLGKGCLHRTTLADLWVVVVVVVV
eukprot:1428903-Prorocentrum_lima.AAC.1